MTDGFAAAGAPGCADGEQHLGRAEGLTTMDFTRHADRLSKKGTGTSQRPASCGAGDSLLAASSLFQHAAQLEFGGRAS